MEKVMGQAKNRGSLQERKEQAVANGREKINGTARAIQVPGDFLGMTVNLLAHRSRAHHRKKKLLAQMASLD